MEKKVGHKITAVKFLVLFVFAVLEPCFGQDSRYSQVFANPLRLNPAMMAVSTDIKATGIYRNQWASIGKGYSTMAFSGIMPLFISEGKRKLDVGLSILSDKAGVFSKTDAAFSVGYSIQLAPSNILSLALLGGFVQNNINTSGLTYEAQYVQGNFDAGAPTNEQTIVQKKSYADVGFGLLWFMNPTRDKSKINAYAGLSGFHLNQPNQSFLGSANAKLSAKYSVQAGIKIMTNKGLDIAPNIRFIEQNGNVESAIGTYIDYCVNDNFKVVVGVWYRNKDAIVIMAGIEHKSFSLGYSYDMSSKPLTTYFSGVNANEVSLGYKLSRISKAKMESFGGGSGTPSVKNNLFNNF